MTARVGLWDRSTIERRVSSSLVETAVQVGHGRRVLALRDAGGNPSLVVWHGPPGRGKTCAGELLCRHALDAAAGQAALLTATFTRVPDVATALRGLLRMGIGVFPERTYRSRTAAELACLVLEALASSHVNILVIDEAGALGPFGLEAVATLVDRAGERGDALHVVLIGMQELPQLLHRNPRVLSRVTEIVTFTPLERDDFGRVLMAHAPERVQALGRTAPYEAVIEQLHRHAAGSLRDALQLLGRTHVYHHETGLPFDLALLSEVALMHTESVQAFLRSAQPKPRQTAAKRSRSFPRPA